MRLLGIGPVGTLVASGVLEQREPLILADFENRSPDSTLGQSLTEAFRVDLRNRPPSGWSTPRRSPTPCGGWSARRPSR